MSADVHEEFVFKEDRTLFPYSDGNLSFSCSVHDDEYSYHKKKMSRMQLLWLGIIAEAMGEREGEWVARLRLNDRWKLEFARLNEKKKEK
ncbi:hypothetical protein RUM43_006753 [Polyplax serrata]|uniref:Uncharacterized protein n=1 Tax=Polyplax serrata TaxID=468196 RepID=A0AAN8PBA1_POLSC